MTVAAFSIMHTSILVLKTVVNESNLKSLKLISKMSTIHYPLHPAQRDIFIDQVMNPASLRYSQGCYVLLKDTVNKSLFLSSVKQMLFAHDVFRLQFDADEPDFPAVLVSELPSTIFLEKDFSDKSEEEALIWMHEQLNTPILLKPGNFPHQHYFLKLSDDTYCYFMHYHHIILDGLGLSNWFKDVAECYQALANDVYSRQEKPSYVSIMKTADEEYNSSVYEQTMNYWKQKFTKPLPSLLEKKYPITGEGTSELYTVALNKKQIDCLASLQKDTGAGLSALSLAVLNIYFGHITGESQFALGVTVHKRRSNWERSSAGMFSGVLPLPGQYDPEKTVRELMAEIRAAQKESYPYYKYLVSDFNALFPGKEDGTPPFGIIVNHGRLDFRLDFGQNIFSDLKLVRNNHQSFPLEIFWQEFGENQPLQIEFIYHKAYFSPEEIQLFADRFLHILVQCSLKPETQLKNFEILPPEELSLLEQFSNSKEIYSSDDTIISMFARQVKESPDSVALISDDEKITYSKLAMLSDALAFQLQKKGVIQGMPVLLSMERTPQLMISILGILKAGAAYVPVEPDLPTDRLAVLMEEVDAEIVVTTSVHASRFTDAEVVCLDTLELFSEQVTDVSVKSTDCAYVMFTSGSTGKPKGVMVTHRNVVSLVKAGDYFPITSDDKILAAGSFAFDASTFEYWGALLNGGTLVMATKAELMDTAKLKSIIRTQKVTKMFFTTGWFNLLADTDVSVFETLSAVIVGGERFSAQHGKKVRKHYPDIHIVNGYGPTENTTFSLAYLTNNSLSDEIPVGVPLNYRSAYILNKDQKQVPIGITGELYVGGAGLSDGYYKQQELTATSFISHLFKENDIEKLYKTGDLVRWLPDGNIVFVGRADDQVKIRGFRIEPAEITTVLLQSPMIQQAMVVARPDPTGVLQLIAYVVDSENAYDKDILLQWLETKLPGYMIPAHIMLLNELPLNANGKVDRNALPDPENTVSGKIENPRNEIENKLAEAWKDLLRIPEVGIRDNFFHLGGHSLMAMRVSAFIKNEWKLRVAPTVLFTCKTIERLAAHIIELQGQNISDPEIISDDHHTGNLPLSFGQERMWFLDRLHGSVQYHIISAFRLTGELDVVSLEKALAYIVDRHEPLHTVIRQEDGVPYQHLLEAGTWKMDRYGEDSLALDDESIQSAIDELAILPFDLSAEHMLRAHLIPLSSHEHILVVNIHHIAADGWSLSVLSRELETCYEAFLNGKEPALPMLTIQYKDYSVWQRQSESLISKKLDYWKHKLNGIASLNMPADYARSPKQSVQGDSMKFKVNKILTEQLKAFSLKEDVTLYMTLLTAFKVLLHRYSSQDDICVGGAISGRLQQEFEPLIGFFVNTLALRTDLGGQPDFREALHRVKATLLEAYDHQEVPFERIVGQVQGDRDTSKNPLFQIVFVLQNAPDVEVSALGEVKIEPIPHHYRTSQFDLHFSINETPDGLQADVVYCTDLFKTSTIERLVGHFETLLHSVVSAADVPINRMTMLSTAETEELLYSFSGTPATYPTEQTIVGLFREQAIRTPDNIAVSFEGEHLSYRSLDEQSTALAIRLKKEGVEKGSLVPICTGHCLEMMVGILGILKAGGVYIPVDPEYPEDRIHFILTDTNAPVVLVMENTFPVVKKIYESKLITLDGDWTMTGESVELPACDPEQPAYIIYTSGSTGRPKGVIIPHRNVVRLFITSDPLFDFNENDVWTMFHSYCFDFSVWEMYGALFYGGRVVIVPRSIARDTIAFTTLLVNEGVTVLNQTPSAFYVLQEYISLNPVSLQVRYVIFGGEALHPMRLKAWHKIFPSCKLINMYGITETTVHVTYQEITEKEMNGSGSIIGKPIPTLRAYILDKDLQPVPVGVPGELCIAGEGVATGYLNREELTAERFVKDPFSKNEYEKLYRAGDLGKWLEDGTIEYLGRIDHQVKIRGYRIELGEIEHAVNTLAEVAENCVVVKNSKDQSDKKLVCYYVPETSSVQHLEKSLFADQVNHLNNRNDEVMVMMEKQIRKALANIIPEYMIPTDIIALEQMPVTSNGKTDRGLLSKLEDQERKRSTGYEAPVSEMEVAITGIWQELLGIERIGVLDNFFEIGGDSIRVVKVAARIKNRLGVEIGVADIYGARTVRDLASLLENSTRDNGNEIHSEIIRELVELEQKYLPLLNTHNQLESVYPMTSIQNGMIYASLRDPDSAVYHDQFLYPVNRKIDKLVFEKALKLMVDKHETFRTTFHLGLHETGLQAVSRHIPVMVEEFDLSGQDINGVKQYLKVYLEKERIISFDIQEGPLWRAALLHWNEGTVFILQFHHAILDGWSVAAFNTELFNLYLQLEKNADYQLLPRLNGHYRDFVKEELTRKKQGSDHAFWKAEMEDHQRLDIFASEEIYENTVVGYNVEVLHHLKDVAKDYGLSLKSVFLGISLYVTSMLSYRRKITIGLVANNRPIVEDGDKLLGCFLNTIPFVFDMPEPGESWINYFKKIDEKLKQLEIHDRTPLAEIARINGESSPKENPFFDVLFNFINFHIYDELEKDLVNVQLGKESLTDTSFGVANTFLNFSISLTGDDMKVVFSLSRMLQSGKTTKDLQYYFDYILNCFRYRAEQEVDKQLLLPATEQEYLIKKLNDTDAGFSKEATLTSCFDKTAEAYPDKIALVALDKEYSYYTLQRWVDRIATLLSNAGVSPGMYVPLMADRTANTVASILAIMKLGAAYVPIDPKMPENRVAMILNDTGATIVVGHQLPVFEFSSEIIFVNTTEASHVTVIEEFPEWSSSSCAYVIYTSGSTGVPKGVPVKHRSVVNLIEGCSQQLGFTADERALQFTNFTFDASVEVMFLSLLNGSTLVLPEDEVLHDPDLFSRLIKTEQISHLVLTPGFLQSLGHIRLSTSLKRIVVGGEECPPALASYWSQYVDFYNEYGPTETTVTATRYKYTQPLKKTPIGKPIQNVSIFVLDELQQLLPAGVQGEICISGEGVTDGYLHRPDLTAHRFIPNEFNTVSGSVMYRTGDIGRWLPDGNLEYEHRADNQVKVRGYRIEPGEIESVLLQHPDIKQAAVLVQKDKHHDNRLIAYVSVTDELPEEQIISYLRTQLPYYMIPAYVQVLPQIPLTISGKVDRNALSIDSPKESESHRIILPVNAMEKMLKDIWVELLGTNEISTDDDFFALGGHSLTTLQLLSRIRSEGYEVQLKEILSHTTIAGQAAFLMNDHKDLIKPEKIVHNEHIRLLNRSSQSQKIFLLPGSNGNCDGYDELADALSPMGAVYGIQMMGVLEGERPLDNMREIAEIQLNWIKEIQPTGPYQFIAHSFGGHALFEMIKQLEQAGEKVEMAAILDISTTLPESFYDAAYVMNFVIGSLIKYGLLTTSEPEWKDDFQHELSTLIAQKKIPNISEMMQSRTLENLETKGLILRIIDLNIANMMLHYTIEGRVDAPFILIKAMQERVPHEFPALGWENHTRSLQVEEIDGGHFTMLYKNFATEIAVLLQQFIVELTE
ncbi:amino acid adenylation domain-containing protein [Chryseobacterium indologenes]|nr:amino acid adenylation domain-containing protein [Chryseobacterium indologenes]